MTEKYDDVLVPFVSLMRKELHANAGKGDRPGWLAMHPNEAMLEVYYHLAKLQKAVRTNDGPAIQEFSADVANMAMMVLDVCGGLAWVDVSKAEESAGSICQPDGLMFDAFGNTRTRAVRITLDGTHLICRPEEVDMNLDGEDRSKLTLTDVYLSDDEIERLPEFEGW